LFIQVTRIKGWRACIAGHGTSISEAIEILNATGEKIVLIVDENQRLSGSISDGDVRRAVLQGKVLGDSATAIMNTEPKFCFENASHTEVEELMRQWGIHQLPILNQEKKIVGIYSWIAPLRLETRENTFVIMAGGEGKRLLPLTQNIPKAMVEIFGQPLIEHIIRKAILEGFKTFVISVNYLGEMIEKYFRDGSSLGVSISYVREKKPLGTAGSLSLLKLENDLPIVVSNCDVVSEISFSAMLEDHQKNDVSATVAVKNHEIQNPFGVLHTLNDRVVKIEEKPISRSNVSAGVYVLNRELIYDISSETPTDMPTLLHEVLNAGREILAYPVIENWVDVGHIDDLNRLKSNYSLKGVQDDKISKTTSDKS